MQLLLDSDLVEITAVFFPVENKLLPIWEVTFCRKYDYLLERGGVFVTYEEKEYSEEDFRFVIAYYNIYDKVLNPLPTIDYYEPSMYPVGTKVYYSKGYKQIAPITIGLVKYPNTYTIDVVTVGEDTKSRDYMDFSEYSPGSYIVRKYYPEYYDTTGKKLESFYIYNAVEE